MSDSQELEKRIVKADKKVGGKVIERKSFQDSDHNGGSKPQLIQLKKREYSIKGAGQQNYEEIGQKKQINLKELQS